MLSKFIAFFPGIEDVCDSKKTRSAPKPANVTGLSVYLKVSTFFSTKSVGVPTLAFGNNNFTVECWYYLTSAPTGQYIADSRSSGVWAFGSVGVATTVTFVVPFATVMMSPSI